MVDPLSAAQTALAAVLLTMQEQDADACDLMFAVPDDDKWSVVSALLGISAAVVSAYCTQADTDPVDYLRAAVLAADPSMKNGE